MRQQESLSEWKTKNPTKATQRKNLTNNLVPASKNKPPIFPLI